MLSNTRLWIGAGMFLSLVACANKPVEKASDFAQADRNGGGELKNWITRIRSYFLSRLCGGEQSPLYIVCSQCFLSRLCGGEHDDKAQKT